MIQDQDSVRVGVHQLGIHVHFRPYELHGCGRKGMLLMKVVRARASSAFAVVTERRGCRPSSLGLRATRVIHLIAIRRR